MNSNKNNGFTLIEMVVVIGVFGIIMASVTGILINSFRAKNKIEVADMVGEVGGEVISELKNNIVAALSTGAVCTTDGTASDSISIINADDGGVTTLKCYENGQIASESANGVFDLTKTGVTVSGCNNFAQCELYSGTTDRISRVNFQFTLFSGSQNAGVDKFVSRQFQSSVTVRN